MVLKYKNLLKLVVAVFLFFSCTKYEKDKKIVDNHTNNSNQNEQKMKLDITEIKKYIELQKKIESDEIEYDNPHDLSIKDLDLALQIINEGLKNNGYKVPTRDKFTSFVNVKQSTDSWYYAKYFDVDCLKWKNDDVFSHFQLVERNQFIFSSKDLFITDFYLLKEIIDINSDDSYTIKLPQTIIARNKYLFNDSKADFAWLKFNDKIFLESLVKTFGYVKDKELLAFVLENNYKEKEELEKIVWNKKCGGEIVVNKEVFDLVKSWKKEKRHDFLMYMLFVVENRKKEFDSNTELTFSQKAKVLGLLSYYSTEIGNIDNTYAYSFFPMLSGKNYDDEFKKNNYYNIPDFKAVYEDARTGGIDIDNWVQPGLTSTQTKIPNTETLITIYDRADFNSFSQEIMTKNEIEYIYKVSDWDFIKVDGRVGYLPPQEQIANAATLKSTKHSFLVDDEPLPEKKKGFWDRLFG